MLIDFAAIRAAAPDAAKTLWKKTSRKILRARLSLTGATDEEKRQAERKLRGREQFRKLQKADTVVASYGKSGRTWLRVMMSRLYQRKYGLPDKLTIGFDNFHRMNRAIPRIFFTHDNYIGDYTGHTDSKVDFYGKKVILLVRDPRDVAVSQFFQWKYRMRPEKKSLNLYPEHDADISVYDFLTHEDSGMPKVIDFMNLWAREIPQLNDFLLVRYEDMRANPHEVLRRLAEFLNIPASAADIDDAVDYASYDNMKKMEATNSFRLSGGRLVPRDKDNPNSYKVRRAKVGGYRDYFEDDEIRRIDALMEETLDPLFGYQAQQAPTQEEEASHSG